MVSNTFSEEKKRMGAFTEAGKKRITYEKEGIGWGKRGGKSSCEHEKRAYFKWNTKDF